MLILAMEVADDDFDDVVMQLGDLGAEKGITVELRACQWCPDHDCYHVDDERTLINVEIVPDKRLN